MAEAAVARGRYAPSPTGHLHLGNARTALLAWLSQRLRARATAGRAVTEVSGGVSGAPSAFVMRIEDLDQARVVPGAEPALLDDLAWLGLDWDEGPGALPSEGGSAVGGDDAGPFGPYRQSARAARYDAAIASLLVAGRAFPCACSRAEIARAASAPHGADDEGPRYPGTCRDLPPAQVEARARGQARAPAIRFRGESERLGFRDVVHGDVEPLGPGGVDDFVLRRADGVAAYQLAVVVDDAAMVITEVVRGDDLLASTPRQLALYRALGATPPRFAHVPLLLAPGGERLAKRTRPRSLATLRAGGADPRELCGRLAASAGLVGPDTIASPNELLALLGAPETLWTRLARGPAVWD